MHRSGQFVGACSCGLLAAKIVIISFCNVWVRIRAGETCDDVDGYRLLRGGLQAVVRAMKVVYACTRQPPSRIPRRRARSWVHLLSPPPLLHLLVI